MVRRSILLAATLGALAAIPGPARHIQLDASAPDGAIRFLSELPRLSLDGDKPTTWVTVTRTGTFGDPRYGEFEITRKMLAAMVENFDKRTYGQDIFIDVSHKVDNGAAGKIVELAVEGSKLRARVEWTPFGVEAIKIRSFRYLSAEYHQDWEDRETRTKHGPMLLGAALTIRPVIKHLDPIQLSEASGGDTPVIAHPELESNLLQEIQIMWKELLKQLGEKLKLKQLSQMVTDQLVSTAERALATVTDKAVAEALIGSFEATGIKLAEQIGGKEMILKIELPSTAAGMTEAQVKKLMEDNRTAIEADAKKLAETRGAKQKLLRDTIAAATGLDEPTKKELADAVIDLVGENLTDEQVKKLAEAQIASGNRLAAQSKLSAMGFEIRGTTHISVDDSNKVKALQEKIDRRVLAEGMDAERFSRTGGKLQERNKQLAEKVLAMFDVDHAAQLHAEHKLLAGGDGIVSDVAVPAIFERTVIREALYNLVGLQFVDTGTYPFSASALIPYSYRDTTAAGIDSTRVYEGGSIPRAGVKQTSDTAYPIPQKIAFEVSDELRYLTSNGQIQWDAVVENVRNAARIIGEDTERLIFNEIVNASDQYAVTAVTDEAVATADGAKTIFSLTNFPAVRPKKLYDLQGNQVGSTLYPIVVKTNAVARDEYDGTGTQANGLYYTMDYNQGEVHFVDELGVAEAPTNTHAVAVSYSYTTNVYAFDTDLGSDTVKDHWDLFLYRYGLRKAIIEDDRYHTANFGMMSGTAMTSVEQSNQFAANFGRPGTDLTADGNLGRVKGVANFRTSAPGLIMGDQRIIIGERAVTRYRMMKPWTMGQLQDQKDSNGRFTGKKEAYGDQFVVLHTPTPLKAAYTSMVLYSATARVDR
jgi:hypothetical protein